MSDVALPIRRLRLEVDRTLRSRDFFARAVTGRLRAREYVDLIDQLVWLVEALTRGEEAQLPQLGHADLASLPAHRPRGGGAAPCPAVRLAREATGSDVIGVEDWTSDTCVAVLGTSWTSDACESLSRSFPGTTSFLSELTDRSRMSMQRLGQRLSRAGQDAQPVYAFAELARGSLLGLATYLDTSWPPPELQLTFNGEHHEHTRAQAPA